MRALAVVVLALVFAAELAALAAYAVWGWAHSPRLVLVWLVPLAGATAWGLLAAPRARYGGARVRPAVKLVFFGLAVLALDDAGHAGWALTLLVAAVVLHALAALPGVTSAVSAASAVSAVSARTDESR